MRMWVVGLLALAAAGDAGPPDRPALEPAVSRPTAVQPRLGAPRPWSPPPRQAGPLALTVDPDSAHRPVLRVGPILADADLEEAVNSGLPLRLHFRVELWRSGFFDRHIGTRDWTAVLLYEPLERRYLVRAERGPAANPLLFSDYTAARAALETVYTPDLGPGGRGRYYYTAELQVETLSLSDLDELRRWLRGELQPAVSGEGSLPGALAEGAKRLLVRLLRLPARTYRTRTPSFRVP